MDGKSNLAETLEAIDYSIGKFNEDIKRGKDLESLMNDPRFKSVILDGYFEKEAKRLFQILTDPTGASPDTTEEIQLKLAAISHFKSYVGTDNFAGTIKIDADRAPSLIIKEMNYRNEVTATYADEE